MSDTQESIATDLGLEEGKSCAPVWDGPDEASILPSDYPPSLSPICHTFSYRFTKRLVDVVLSSVALLTLWPVFIVIAIAIKVASDGPIFYRWHVIGKQE